MICRRCGKEYPVEKFGKNSRYPNGIYPVCNECAYICDMIAWVNRASKIGELPRSTYYRIRKADPRWVEPEPLPELPDRYFQYSWITPVGRLSRAGEAITPYDAENVFEANEIQQLLENP